MSDFVEHLRENCKHLVRSWLNRWSARLSENEIEDLTQEVASVFWRKRASVDPGRDRAFASQIACHLVKQWFDKANRRPVIVDSEITAAAPDRMKTIGADDAFRTDDQIAERLNELKAYLLQGRSHGWKPLQVFELLKQTGFDRKETAKALGKSLGYVDGNLNRFRASAKAFQRIVAKPDEWQTVNDIIVGHRDLMNVSGYQATVDVMWNHTNTAWVKASRTPSYVPQAALWSAALARWLQQCGDFDGARRSIAMVMRLGSWDTVRSRISEDAAEAVLTTDVRLKQRPFGTAASERDLEIANNRFHRMTNWSKFFWRTALDEIARGRTLHVDSIMARYLDVMAHNRIPSANVFFVDTFRRFQEGNYEAATDSARRYRHIQQEVWTKRRDIPDPSIQGVLTGLYLEAFAFAASPLAKTEQRRELTEFLDILSRCRTEMRIGGVADGLREIGELTKALCPEFGNPIRPATGRKTKKRTGKGRDFLGLIERLESIVS